MKKANVLMLIAVLMFSACKKNDNENSKPQSYRIVSVQENNEDPSTYTYDDKGRVSKVTDLYGYGTGIFTYTDTRVTFTKTLNESKKYFTVTNGRILTDEYDSYDYDPENFLKSKSASQSGVPDYTLSYSNQNMVKVVSKDGRETTIDYYEGEEYQNLLGFENALYSSLLFNESTFSNFNAMFTGKRSKNLVKSITTTKQIAGRTFRYYETYRYEKDQDGKIVLMATLLEAPTGMRMSEYKFTYEAY